MMILDHDGTATELKTGETVVGSAKDAGVRIQNADLAPRHFLVVVGPNGAATIRPDSPRHLVTVNGHAIADSMLLSAGDVIGAGHARLRFLGDGSSWSARQPMPDESAYLRTPDGITYAIARRTLQIGRDAGSNIQLRDPDVSRNHADIRAEAGVHVLYSMGAAGTKVNGETVRQPRILHEGDRIEIGTDVFVYTRSAPPPGARISSGGEAYDLEISQQLTGSQRRLMDHPGKALNNPRILRVVAIVVGVMAIAVIVLLFI